MHALLEVDDVRREMYQWLLSVVVIIVAPGLLAAGGDEHVCPPQWNWFISEIEQHYSTEDRTESPILIADGDGSLFDCFGTNIERGLFAAVEEQEVKIASMIANTDHRQRNGWPSNWCTIGSTGTADLQIQIVVLPYVLDVLESETCMRRVSAFAEAIN